MTFSIFLFWAWNFECAWVEKLNFIPFQMCFWHVYLRYNCMYTCLFKLTWTQSVRTSISDNFFIVVRFECMTGHFDCFDLTIYLKLSKPQLDSWNKIEPKHKRCMDIRARAPEVQIECKLLRFDHVDLTTHVKAFLCQLDTQNKARSKTLIVHGFPCQCPLLDF